MALARSCPTAGPTSTIGQSDRGALGGDEPTGLAHGDVGGGHDLGHLLDVAEHAHVGGAEARDARPELVGEAVVAAGDDGDRRAGHRGDGGKRDGERRLEAAYGPGCVAPASASTTRRSGAKSSRSRASAGSIGSRELRADRDAGDADVAVGGSSAQELLALGLVGDAEEVDPAVRPEAVEAVVGGDRGDRDARRGRRLRVAQAARFAASPWVVTIAEGLCSRSQVVNRL